MFLKLDKFNLDLNLFQTFLLERLYPILNLLIGPEIEEVTDIKQCPSCDGYIEKADGCDNMTCPCGHTFLWSSIGGASSSGTSSGQGFKTF